MNYKVLFMIKKKYYKCILGILLFSCSFKIKMSGSTATNTPVEDFLKDYIESCLGYDWDFEEQVIKLLGQKKANMLLYLFGSTINYYPQVHQNTSMWNDLNKFVNNKLYTDKIFKIAEELANKRQ